jgi:uncharacterized protein involved in exopolysaccharide biosynthesis
MATVTPAELSQRGSLNRAPDPDITADGEISLLSIANTLLRFRRFIAAIAVGAAILFTAPILFRPRLYQSSSSFTPEGAKSTQSLAGIAQLLGAGAGIDGGQSPAFYADLVTSKTMLDQLASTRFARAGRDSATLYELLAEGRPLDDREKAKIIQRLQGDVTAEVAARTGVVRLRVAMPSAALAHEANAALLRLLNRFNINTRQSQASAQRQFAERRVAEIGAELKAAEAERLDFQMRNRDYRQAPALALEAERISRNIGRLTTLYASLSESYEKAKIDEVRDTPVLTTVEAPDLPVSPMPRGLIVRAAIALIGGAFVGVFLSLALQFIVDNANETGAALYRYPYLRRFLQGRLARAIATAAGGRRQTLAER